MQGLRGGAEQTGGRQVAVDRHTPFLGLALAPSLDEADAFGLRRRLRALHLREARSRAFSVPRAIGSASRCASSVRVASSLWAMARSFYRERAPGEEGLFGLLLQGLEGRSLQRPIKLARWVEVGEPHQDCCGRDLRLIDTQFDCKVVGNRVDIAPAVKLARRGDLSRLAPRVPRSLRRPPCLSSPPSPADRPPRMRR